MGLYWKINCWNSKRVSGRTWENNRWSCWVEIWKVGRSKSHVQKSWSKWYRKNEGKIRRNWYYKKWYGGFEIETDWWSQGKNGVSKIIDRNWKRKFLQDFQRWLKTRANEFLRFSIKKPKYQWRRLITHGWKRRLETKFDRQKVVIYIDWWLDYAKIRF